VNHICIAIEQRACHGSHNLSLSADSKLDAVEPRVLAVLGKKCLVTAGLDDGAVIEHEDDVGAADRCEAMCNRD
jgi:hypothetical protein